MDEAMAIECETTFEAYAWDLEGRSCPLCEGELVRTWLRGLFSGHEVARDIIMIMCGCCDYYEEV